MFYYILTRDNCVCVCVFTRIFGISKYSGAKVREKFSFPLAPVRSVVRRTPVLFVRLRMVIGCLVFLCANLSDMEITRWTYQQNMRRQIVIRPFFMVTNRKTGDKRCIFAYFHFKTGVSHKKNDIFAKWIF